MAQQLRIPQHIEHQYKKTFMEQIADFTVIARMKDQFQHVNTRLFRRLCSIFFYLSLLVFITGLFGEPRTHDLLLPGISYFIFSLFYYQLADSKVARNLLILSVHPVLFGIALKHSIFHPMLSFFVVAIVFISLVSSLRFTILNAMMFGVYVLFIAMAHMQLHVNMLWVVLLWQSAIGLTTWICHEFKVPSGNLAWFVHQYSYMMLSTMRELTTDPDVDKILPKFVKSISEISGANYSQVLLLDESGKQLNSAFLLLDSKFQCPFNDMQKLNHHLSLDDFPHFFDLDAHLLHAITCRVKTNSDNRYYQMMKRLGIQHMIQIPLIERDRLIGILCLGFIDRQQVERIPIELLETLAWQITLATQLTTLVNQAQAQSLQEERIRIANDIHDLLAQGYAGIGMQFHVMEKLLNKQQYDEAKAKLRQLDGFTRVSLNEVKKCIHELYYNQQENSNLAENLADIISLFYDRCGIEIVIGTEGEDTPLCKEIARQLIYVAQEAIANAVKHAQPKQIDIVITYLSGRVQLTVRDDGCGLQLGPPGMGLIGMRNRMQKIQGDFQIISYPGYGTSIQASAPIRI